MLLQNAATCTINIHREKSILLPFGKKKSNQL